jgi:hypothetical protein
MPFFGMEVKIHAGGDSGLTFNDLLVERMSGKRRDIHLSELD